MTIEDMLSMMQANPVFQLATVDDSGQVHTRAMLLYKANLDGIIFHTGAFKSVYTQMSTQPKVELCFNDFKAGIQVRVQGLAIEDHRPALRQEIIAAPGREFLKPVVASQGPEVVRVFRVRNLQAQSWSMTTNLTYPKTMLTWATI